MKEQDLLALGFKKVIDEDFNGKGKPLVYFSNGDFLSNAEDEAKENDGNYTIELLGSEYDYVLSDKKDIEELFAILGRATKKESGFTF